MIELCVVCEHFGTNRVLLGEACKWCCIKNEQYRAEHRALRNTEIQGRKRWDRSVCVCVWGGAGGVRGDRNGVS